MFCEVQAFGCFNSPICGFSIARFKFYGRGGFETFFTQTPPNLCGIGLCVSPNAINAKHKS